MNTNATVLATYQFLDFMDGDAMVCSPSGPSEYRNMCNFYQYGLGVAYTIGGISFLYNAKRLGRLLSRTAPESKNPLSEKETASKKKQTRNIAQLLFFKRFTYVMGFNIGGLGVALLIGSTGTVYATSTIAGLGSDFAFSISIAWNLYQSLLQLRGADAFRSLVELPTNSDGIRQKRKWVTFVLDGAQGGGAFPITFGFWLLLASRVIKRSELYSALFILMAAAGIRSMIENILNRVRTLARIDELQQNAGGGIEARRRRRETLTKKARVLIFHMMVILAFNALFPVSLLIFGSVNSSTQMLFHCGAGNTIFSIFVLAGCISTHKHVNRSCAREAVNDTTAERGDPSNKPEYTVADESGMSVVGVSELANSKGNVDLSSGGGLFSDIESEDITTNKQVSTSCTSKISQMRT